MLPHDRVPMSDSAASPLSRSAVMAVLDELLDSWQARATRGNTG